MDNFTQFLGRIELLKNENKILSKQISIAIQGLEVIISMGDSMNKSVAENTIKAMEDCEEDNSSQEN